MLESYLTILVMVIVGVAFGVVPMLIARLIAPHRPNKRKRQPYECGFPTQNEARMPFDVKFYLIAILFIIFDVETSLLFPWAATLDQTSLSGFLSMMCFLLILVVGFVYEWKRGAFEWN